MIPALVDGSRLAAHLPLQMRATRNVPSMPPAFRASTTSWTAPWTTCGSDRRDAIPSKRTDMRLLAAANSNVPGNARPEAFEPGDLRSQLPSPLSRTDAGPWVPPSSGAQTAAALAAADGAIARALEQPGADAWVAQLTKVMQERSQAMPEGSAGLRMTLCFPATYSGSVRHLAMATVWRDAQSSQLKVAFMHQESIPRATERGETFIGRMYDRFDTSEDYPGGKAPVVESIRLSGLPTVNVAVCARPQDLPGTVEALRDVYGDHPYGPNDKWSAVPADLQGKPFATCFTITELGVRATNGEMLKLPDEPTLPGTFSRMAPLVSTDVERYNAIKIGKDTTDLAGFDELSGTKAKQVFFAIGTTWGADQAWDVDSIHEVTGARTSLGPGSRVTLADDPDVHAIKFTAAPRGVELDGELVQGGTTYSADAVRRMVVTSDSPVKVSFDIARIRQA